MDLSCQQLHMVLFILDPTYTGKEKNSDAKSAAKRESMLRIKSIFCKIKGHVLVMAGSCPYTGSTYEYCERCTAMIPVQKAV